MNRAVNISNPSHTGILSLSPGETMPLQGLTTSVRDEFADEVALAQSQLEDLQKRQLEIEIQKNTLKRLQEKQSGFQTSRTDIIGDLEQALEILERNHFQAEQRIENYARTRECFAHHLSIVSSLRTEDWERERLEIEIDRAKICIDEARSEYDRALANLHRLDLDIEEIPGAESSQNNGTVTDNAGKGKPTVAQRGFLYWLRSGFAFTLPIMIFGGLAIAYMIFFN